MASDHWEHALNAVPNKVGYYSAAVSIHPRALHENIEVREWGGDRTKALRSAMGLTDQDHNGYAVGVFRDGTTAAFTPGGHVLVRRPSPEVRRCECFPHGPDDPCTCSGCWACSGGVVGCTCDIAWDCEHMSGAK